MQITAAEVTAAIADVAAILVPRLTAAGRTGLAGIVTWLASTVPSDPALAGYVAALMTSQWANLPAEFQAMVSQFKAGTAAVEAWIAKL